MPNALDTQGIPEPAGRRMRPGACPALAQTREHAELMHALTCHRRALLELVHQTEKRIGCLGYLIDQMEKKPRGREL